MNAFEEFLNHIEDSNYDRIIELNNKYNFRKFIMDDRFRYYESRFNNLFCSCLKENHKKIIEYLILNRIYTKYELEYGIEAVIDDNNFDMIKFIIMIMIKNNLDINTYLNDCDKDNRLNEDLDENGNEINNPNDTDNNTDKKSVQDIDKKKKNTLGEMLKDMKGKEKTKNNNVVMRKTIDYVRKIISYHFTKICVDGNFDLANWFINNVKDHILIEDYDEDGDVLYQVCLDGNIEMAKLLLDNFKFDMIDNNNSDDNCDGYIFSDVFENGDYDMARFLLNVKNNRSISSRDIGYGLVLNNGDDRELLFRILEEELSNDKLEEIFSEDNGAFCFIIDNDKKLEFVEYLLDKEYITSKVIETGLNHVSKSDDKKLKKYFFDLRLKYTYENE